MTRYVQLEEILHLHVRIIQESGGAEGLRDLGMLESAIAPSPRKPQPLGFPWLPIIRSWTATSASDTPLSRLS